MSNITKQDILDAIRKTAEKNGGSPLGAARFESESGFKPYDWEKFWTKFGDAQREAGFVPNQFSFAYADELLIQKLIDLIRKLNRFPGRRDLTVAKNSNAAFPSESAFRRFGNTKKEQAKKVYTYIKDKNGYEDIVNICTLIIKETLGQKNLEKNGNKSGEIGEVYLFKSGRYYKIGKTNDTVRRGAELRIQLPEKMDLIHSIKTDDPSGIEAYWHKRFEAKRMQGEWFDLNSADIKAFKRWRRII
ncbi:MAG: GIY-YIG nuclease family protein [Patescibacteria group bacterium]